MCIIKGMRRFFELWSIPIERINSKNAHIVATIFSSNVQNKVYLG